MLHHLSEHPVSNEDFEQIHAFAAVMWREEDTPVAPVPSALSSRWFERGYLRRWLDQQGMLAGVAHRIVDSGGVTHLETAIRPEHREMVLFESMLAWALDEAAGDRGEPPTAASPIRVTVPESDVSLPFCLLRLGFTADPQGLETVWSLTADTDTKIEETLEVDTLSIDTAIEDAESRRQWVDSVRSILAAGGRRLVARIASPTASRSPGVEALRTAGFEMVDTWQTYEATLSSQAVRHSTD